MFRFAVALVFFLSLLLRAMTLDDIDSLIQVNRMETILFQVQKECGEPLPAAEISIHQQDHAFQFGSVVSGFFNSWEPAIQQMYEDTLLKYFNTGVDEWHLKWPSVEPSRDNLNFEPAEQIYNWCVGNNLDYRGHTIFWANRSKVPAWARDLPDAELLEEMREHVSDVMENFPEVHEWDLNNEMILSDLPWHYFRNRFGDSIIDSMFTWGLQVNPGAVFYLNEFGIINTYLHELYVELIQSLLDEAIPLGGIGIQGHVFTSDDPVEMGVFAGDSVFTADYLWNVLELFAPFNLPIKITEFDFDAPDDSTHARWLTVFYKVMYAHPLVEGVIMWGFWEAVHWRPETAIFNEDFSPKPSAIAYYELVFNEWWIDDTLITNEFGAVKDTLFQGSYEISTYSSGIELTQQIEISPAITGVDTLTITFPIICDSTLCTIGDVNCDGQINVSDIVQMVSFILAVDTPTEDEFERSDLNLDGQIDVTDIILLIQIILG